MAIDIEATYIFYRLCDHGRVPNLDMTEWTRKARRHSKRWYRKHPKDLWSVCIITYTDGTGWITKPELMKEGKDESNTCAGQDANKM